MNRWVESKLCILLSSLAGLLVICCCQDNTPCKSLARASSTLCVSIWCYHGDCVHAEIELIFGKEIIGTCECDVGWHGPSCDLCCDLECVPGFGCRAQYDPDSRSYITGCYTQNVEDIDITTSDPETVTTRTRLSIHNSSHVDSSIEKNNRTADVCMSSKRNTRRLCNGLHCYHGDCVTQSNMTKCQCHPGWDGHQCDECCDLDCSGGLCQIAMATEGKTMRCSGNTTQTVTTATNYKNEADNFTNNDATIATDLNKTSDENVTSETFTTSMKQNVTQTDSVETFTIATTTDPNATSIVCKSIARETRTLCISLYCYNGHCNQHEAITIPGLPGYSLQTGACVCDPGWYDDRCLTCCHLECNNGSCRVEFPGNQMRCFCFPGYTGEYCDIEIPPTTLATRNITIRKYT